MAGSSSAVRRLVLEQLEPGVTLSGETFGELREKLGIPHPQVSNTQFSKAVRSLHFNYGVINYSRSWEDSLHGQTKDHRISLR